MTLEEKILEGLKKGWKSEHLKEKEWSRKVAETAIENKAV